MRKYLLLVLTISSFSSTLLSQGITLPPSGDNQKCSVTQHIGSLVTVTVDYSSPDVTGPGGEDRTKKYRCYDRKTQEQEGR